MPNLIEIPDDVYRELLRTAAKLHTTPAEWISRMVKDTSALSVDEHDNTDEMTKIAAANDRLRALRIPTDQVRRDNTEMDADLAARYAYELLDRTKKAA